MMVLSKHPKNFNVCRQEAVLAITADQLTLLNPPHGVRHPPPLSSKKLRHTMNTHAEDVY